MREDVLAQETVPSKFDTLGENLLQAVADNRSVVGGLRYLDKLAACQLDGTLESLKKIDKLLTAVRRDLLRQGLAENELKAVDFRNFVLYVAFYAGHVAKNMAGMALTWQAGETLGQQYPKINTKSFYQLMVLTALDGQSTPLFLLQNIGARLFASVQRTFVSPVDNEPVAESVYWAVDSWLTQFKIIATKAAVPLSQDDNGDTKAHLALQTSTAQKMPSALSQPTGSQATAHKAVSLSIQETVIQKPIIQEPVIQKPIIQDVSTGLSADTLDNASMSSAITQPTKPIAQPIQQTTKQPAKHSAKKIPSNIFAEVKGDLINLPAVNDTAHSDYQKAAAMVDKVEGLIAEQMQVQNLPYAEIVVGSKATLLRQNGIKLLLQTAKLGNTNAMIKLALCYFEGTGLAQDDEKGVHLIKAAADKGDSRAQKLLSKLYYQGIGVTQNVSMGEIWLAKAATSGHPEAKKIQSYMNQIQLMKDDYRTQSHKDKRFMQLLAAAGILLIMAIWLSVKFL